MISIASQRSPCVGIFYPIGLTRLNRATTVGRFDHWHEPARGSGFANALKAAPQLQDHIVDEAAQTPSSRAKTEPIGGSPFAFPKFLMGKFEFPPEFRELAEKSAMQAKESCEKM